MSPSGVFPFMQLPLEMRRKIYCEALIFSDSPVDPDILGLRKICDDRIFPYSTPINTALLRVSKVINLEATSVLYGANTFAFSDFPYDDNLSELLFGMDAEESVAGYPCGFLGLPQFLRTIGARNQRSIRHLTFTFHGCRFLGVAYSPLRGSRDLRYLVADAFTLLSVGHYLVKLKLNFENFAAFSAFGHALQLVRNDSSGLEVKDKNTVKFGRKFFSLQGVREVEIKIPIIGEGGIPTRCARRVCAECVQGHKIPPFAYEEVERIKELWKSSPSTKMPDQILNTPLAVKAVTAKVKRHHEIIEQREDYLRQRTFILQQLADVDSGLENLTKAMKKYQDNSDSEQTNKIM